jgi:hypothetical protein
MRSRHLNNTRLLLTCVLLLTTTVHTLAQLQIAPVERRVPAPARQSANGRTQALKPMELPFWDDFSDRSTAKLNSPNDSLWESGADVYVNNGLAINPPTIYVASFDGLKGNGLPYNVTDVQSSGFTDSLVSRRLRMDLADKGSTYLTFFFQWQGNGDPPEDTDFLLLEFKDNTGKWVERTKIYPQGHTDKTRFYDTMLYVAGDKFYHENFQFRFRSYGRESGPFDVWNIDYVHLDEGRTPAQPRRFRDRALASAPRTMLRDYRAIPLAHFVQNPQFYRTYIDLFNLSGPISSAVGLITHADITNYYSDQAPVQYAAVLKDTLAGGDIASYQRLPYAYINNLDASTVLQLNPMPDSIDMTVKVTLDSKDEDDVNTVQNDGVFLLPDYDPHVNDTIFEKYQFNDYYAYDDGSAEYAALLTNSGDRCVVEYNMLTEDYAYLTAIDVYMPDFGLTANQTVDFLVYGPSPGGEGPSKTPELVVNRTVTGQGIDKFFQIKFSPAVQVKDRFYVGWLAPAIGKPKVGLDYSNDSGNRMWVMANGNWAQNPSGFNSSLMIRPHVQPSEPPVVPVIPEVEKGSLTVFPNPCQGTCFIRGNYDRLALLNSTGQPIPFEEEHLSDRTRLSFPTAAPGLYLLRITAGNISRTEKIIVAE